MSGSPRKGKSGASTVQSRTGSKTSSRKANGKAASTNGSATPTAAGKTDVKGLQSQLELETRRNAQLTELVEEWRALVVEQREQLVELRKTAKEARAEHQSELKAALDELKSNETVLRQLQADQNTAADKIRALTASVATAREHAARFQAAGNTMLGRLNKRLAETMWQERAQAREAWKSRPRPRKRLAALSRRRPFVTLLRRFGIGQGFILFCSGLYAAQDGPGGRNLLRLARNHSSALGPHPLFDIDHYAAQAKDIAPHGAALPVHYLMAGDAEGRSPHAMFDPTWYRDTYAGSLESWPLSSLEHFLIHGAYDGFDPHPLFSLDHYVSQVPELARSGRNPLAHYLAVGWREGYDPHPLFSTSWYVEKNPDVAQAGIPPLLHYLKKGAAEQRDPHPLFSTGDYARNNPDVISVGINPLVHYAQTGWKENRNPSSHFDVAWYLERNPDVAEFGVEPLTHYLTTGGWEGRDCAEGFDQARFLAAFPDTLLEGKTPLEAWVRMGKPDTADLVPSAAISTSELDDTLPLVSSAPSAGNRNLFRQLYEAARDEDTDNYNWPTYKTLATKLATRERQRIEALDLEPANLLNLSEANISRVAKNLKLKSSATPTVSIVIPVYNAIKYTVECLKSLEQTRTKIPMEIIVIDDESSDATQKVLADVDGLKYLRNEENLGFLRTVNRAAAQARGKYLIVLNNDVQVTPNWLDPLVEALEDETVGVVAPMMLFPNGRLQEAGARLDPDGNSRMIGLFDDPMLPRYNYARDVDYVSGACIAVRRTEFEEIGGFDLAFAPAYCEDCDLCFKYTAKGLRIRYEPASKIYHHLSISSNALPGSYKMRQVRKNQQKLLDRWGEAIDAAHDVKVISLYLPQFHTIPENDRWWGAGFTEWTNVTRALPNFAGHYQPHRPAELGSYDLTNPEVMERQAKLAKRYGIQGFCYYYYWFSGRRVLETPLERMLETGKPDMPFCLCWANENWTRTWDGQEKDVLLEQKYRTEDDRAIILDLIRYMRSDNYIRVNGKPLVVVYRPQLLPDAKATAKLWREICREEGIGEIYLSFMEVFESARSYPDPAAIGFDATIEFPPSNTSLPMSPPGELFNPDYDGTVTDYRRLVETYMEEPIPAHTRFRGAMPSWDNTARRQDHSFVFQNASPGAFQAWLEQIIEQTRDQNSAGERLVFVNAWNEWAEGAHLEPDVKFGRGWLEAVRNALDSKNLLKD